jgi:hypothetical protein
MPRKHIKARPLFRPAGVSGQASTAWDALAVILKRTEERPPVHAGGPSAQPRVTRHEGAVRGHRTAR